MERLVGTGADVTILSPKSWNLRLASSEDKCSVSRGWNFITDKVKYKIGHMFSTRRTGRESKDICG